MTITEAQRAAGEISRSSKDPHTEKLLKAIEDFDLEALGETIDEGVKDTLPGMKTLKIIKTVP